MEYQALYRKYRPKTFEDVYGQKIVVQTLKNVIKNNKLTHAYLFVGPRGTGKTSIAKIFAKTINCLNPKEGISCEQCEICKNINNNENIDIIEMDAASNNGVDEIREIKNHVTLLPTTSKYKIYIIDEVHMLTTGAFNALLKTLEEPPKHVIFILATTEPHKIPLTIISRCQSFEFKPIPKNIIKERLKYICEKENIIIDEESLDLIALDSNGGMRDAIGLLDQLNAYSNGNIKYDDVLLLNGRISTEDIKKIFINIKEKQLKKVFDIIENFENSGKNFAYISEDIIKLLRNELVTYKTDGKSETIDIIDNEKILEVINLINKSINDIKNSKDKKIFFDIMILKIYEIINKNQTNVLYNNTINASNVQKNDEKIKIEVNKTDGNNIINNEETQSLDLYEELMNIRLNNILSAANKEKMIEYKEKILKLDSEVSNLDQLRVINSLMECEVKAGSENGIVLTTDIKNLLNDLWKDFIIIDDMISEVIGRKIKICILLNEVWLEKRMIYVDKIKRKEKIQILDETEIVKKINSANNKEFDDEFSELLEIGGE
ncbi:MAG: DNA polymerase III subunit gamma/tau [Bacilli bacterium]|nr:DNA polymerase III subunit gamma/tau [Bacilli bacterium]